MDVLGNILHSARVESTVFSRAELTAPWGVHTRGLDAGIFHAVVRGSCHFILDGNDGPPVALTAGDLVVLPHGHAHVMCDRPTTPAVPIESLLRGDTTGPVDLLEAGGSGARTTLLCGRIDFEHGVGHPLLSVLPPAITLKAEDETTSRWLATTVRLLLSEVQSERPGASTVITRLADVLVVQALRSHIEALQPGAGGWLAGLKDPQVRRALSLIHTRPDEPWTAASLASSVGMSRSAFFGRFAELVGDPPGRYLTQWRIFLTARALRMGNESLAALAEQVGYGSEAALSKAFKRTTGFSPSVYRRAHD